MSDDKKDTKRSDPGGEPEIPVKPVGRVKKGVRGIPTTIREQKQQTREGSKEKEKGKKSKE